MMHSVSDMPNELMPMTQALAEFSHTPDQWQMPIKTPLGTMTLMAHSLGLCGAWFEHQKHAPELDQTPWGPDQPWLLSAKHQLMDYFSGKRTQFDVPLMPFGGTAFQASLHTTFEPLFQTLRTPLPVIGPEDRVAKAGRRRLRHRHD